MLQGSSQVRMRIIGLGMQECFDLLEAGLDGRKKRSCVQPVSFQAKSRRAFSLVTAATCRVSHE